MVQMSSAILQIPTEGERCMLFVEEIGDGGFMQAKVNELPNDSVEYQSQSKILRKVQASIPRRKKRCSFFPVSEQNCTIVA